MRQPTPNERAGMDWWNALTKQARSFWLEEAERKGHTPSAAEAWNIYKQHQPKRIQDEGEGNTL